MALAGIDDLDHALATIAVAMRPAATGTAPQPRYNPSTLAVHATKVREHPHAHRQG
jgi:hypothetical protein